MSSRVVKQVYAEAELPGFRLKILVDELIAQRPRQEHLMVVHRQLRSMAADVVAAMGEAPTEEE